MLRSKDLNVNIDFDSSIWKNAASYSVILYIYNIAQKKANFDSLVNENYTYNHEIDLNADYYIIFIVF